MDEKTKYFETLFDAHSDAIFRHLYYSLGNRERAKELTQEVFMRVWQHLSADKEISYEKAFLYKIARNLFINEIRTNKTTHSLDSLTEETGFEAHDNEVNPLQSAEQLEVIRYLDQLQESYREVIVLRFINGLSVKAIAELTEEKETNISMRIARALEKLKNLYGQN